MAMASNISWKYFIIWSKILVLEVLDICRWKDFSKDLDYHRAVRLKSPFSGKNDKSSVRETFSQFSLSILTNCNNNMSGIKVSDEQTDAHFVGH